MTTRKYSSRAQQTTLSSGITSGDVTMTVGSGANLMGGKTPAVGETYTVVIDPDTALEEIVDVSNYASGNTLNIGRGVDGSTAVAHSAGAIVRHMVIGRDLTETNNHIENVTNPHGVTLANLVKTTDTGTVTSTMILDGTILNADINASAGIVDTKLATIATASKVSNSATTAASANTASAIVARDASGNFTAGTITANLTGTVTGNVTGNLTGNVTGNVTGSSGSTTGNAATATALATGRTISIAGDVTGTSASFNGTANASITVAYAANSIVNDDINASAGIALSKLATDPLARANHTGTQAASTITDLASTVKAYRLDEFATPNTSVALGLNKLTGVSDPTLAQDAATKSYVDTSISNLIAGAPSTLNTLDEIAAALADTANFSDTVVLKTGSTMSGALAMGTNKITGLGDPTSAQDAATKYYIDNVILAPSNLTGPITSVGNATSIASQTGTGTKFVVDTSPTLVTPVLGVATATSINGTTIPSSKTLVATDSTTYVVPSQTSNSGKYLTTNGTVSSWTPPTGASAGTYTLTTVTVDSNGRITAISSGTAQGETFNPLMLMGA